MSENANVRVSCSHIFLNLSHVTKGLSGCAEEISNTQRHKTDISWKKCVIYNTQRKMSTSKNKEIQDLLVIRAEASVNVL